MKKLSVYLLLIGFLLITGCGSNKVKEVATLDTFERVSINQGFTVNDNMEMYKDVDYILESKKAIYDDIEIEMVRYTDSDYATRAQDNHIESFNLLKNTGAFVEKEKGSNYYSYALVSNGRYMISTKVGETLLFSKTMLKNKEKVDALINALGY